MTVAAYSTENGMPIIPTTGAPATIGKRSQSIRAYQPRRKPQSWKTWLRNVWVWAAAVVAITGGASYGLLHARSSGKVAAGEDADGANRLKIVRIARPEEAERAPVVLPATVRPWQTTTLHARVSGYLKAWHYDLGARVKAGDLLAEIDTPELDQELAEGKALAREAAAAAVQARAERTEADADLKVAEGQLARLKADLELVKSQLVRREKLVVNGAVTREEYDTFRKQTEARTADVAAAQSDVDRRRANLATRDAIIDVREATSKSRESNVGRLSELQTFKRIVAPFDGVVMRRTAEVGMLVTSGQDALFVIEDNHRVRVQVSVPQTYAGQTQPGVTAEIHIPEAATGDVSATVTRIAESVDPASRTMLAEIELENGGRRLQPGSYVQVQLTLPHAEVAWTIPSSALAMRVDGPHVAVVDERDQIAMKSVRLGRDLGSRVVVLQGISGDERLVVNPGEDLTSGSRVRVNEGREPAGELAQR
ncbi:MAG TPA: efflux RND transporter periplasmic adaptor subunit [Pirellulales bacterium]|nr:efflux RND transporter periplasmic adaptor subunit [Pirellulales bacterium]